jgi:serine O-acetyltransferase
VESTLTPSELCDYLSRQLNHFFPDGQSVILRDYGGALDLALDRVAYCFKHVSLKSYCINGQPRFNHLFSDQYVVFLWFLANSIWRHEGPSPLANKIYYLNKALHAFDSLYDNNLPDIFLVFHTVGTVLGKAEYSDFLVVAQGCTVGAHKGQYPKLGRGVGLATNSAVLGSCVVGARASIGAGTMVFCQDVPPDTAVYRDHEGAMVSKIASPGFAQQMFTCDLNVFSRGV